VVGVVVLSVSRSPLSEIGAGALDAVALIGSGLPSLELDERSILTAPLASSVLNAVDVGVVLALSLVIVVMPASGDALQVGEVIVLVVAVSMVNFVSV
jgi:hypothetical protein